MISHVMQDNSNVMFLIASSRHTHLLHNSGLSRVS